MAKQVSKTYGSALFEVALESNTLDATLEEVLFVKQTFLENEDLNK
ncbi:MAG: F0F1 ATP synthase subunit delta, partial [Opitutales bacterium]|nr:F0F1 ATP synthase subunit delta [Opitutales bacterium]